MSSARTGTPRRPRAVVAHPFWGRGGAEASAMWTLSALVEDFDVTVYTRGGFDIGDLNRLARTDLRTDRIGLRRAPEKLALPVGALAAGAFLRSLSRIGAEFDLRVSASGILPWGRPAIHFISSIQWNDRLVAGLAGPSTRRPNLRTRLSKALIDFSSWHRRGPGAGDVFVANSDWTRRQCGSVIPGSIHLIHPVIPDLPAGRPWVEREDSVLVFGRISPEKRIESCITILETARARGAPLRLVIAGPPGEDAYFTQIASLCQARRHWIELLPAQSGNEKTDLLGKVRYGLSACRIEAFGIATGEMAASGIVVIVPDGTGQCEIITDPSQKYRTEDEAALCLLALVHDPVLQFRKHEAARLTAEYFSAPRFMESVRHLCRDMLDRSGKATKEP